MLVAQWSGGLPLGLDDRAYFESLEQYGDTDAVMIADEYWKCQASFAEAVRYGSLTIVYADGLDLLEARTDLTSEDELIFILVGDVDAELAEVCRLCPQFTHYDELGSYAYGVTYHAY